MKVCNKKLRLIGSGIAASLAALCVTACGEQAPALQGRRPNIVLVVIDTLRFDAIIGSPSLVETPNIDALAADGILFANAFSHAPITLPSHTALFSSRPPFETGVMNNGQPLPPELPLFADWLEDYNYATRAIISLGTLHLGGQSSVNRGFQEFDVGFWRMAQAPEVVSRIEPHLDALTAQQPFLLFAHFSDPHEPYNSHQEMIRTADIWVDGELVETVSTADMTLWRKEMDLTPGTHTLEVKAEDEFTVRWLGAVANDADVASHWELGKRLDPAKHVKVVLEQKEDSMLAAELRLWINDVPSRAEKLKRYKTEIRFADQWIGSLMAELKARDLYENSLIVFTSDHGEAVGERGHFGHIQTVYDEQIHVPLIMKLPKGDPRSEALASQSGTVVPHTDLVPTILELVGLPPLPMQRGKSLLAGGSGLVLAQTHKPQAKLDLVCLRDDRYKLIFDATNDRFELYDIVADPFERKDLYPESPELRGEWEVQLREVARLSALGGLNLDDLNESTRQNLEALGY